MSKQDRNLEATLFQKLNSVSFSNDNLEFVYVKTPPPVSPSRVPNLVAIQPNHQTAVSPSRVPNLVAIQPNHQTAVSPSRVPNLVAIQPNHQTAVSPSRVPNLVAIQPNHQTAVSPSRVPNLVAIQPNHQTAVSPSRVPNLVAIQPNHQTAVSHQTCTHLIQYLIKLKYIVPLSITAWLTDVSIVECGQQVTYDFESTSLRPIHEGTSSPHNCDYSIATKVKDTSVFALFAPSGDGDTYCSGKRLVRKAFLSGSPTISAASSPKFPKKRRRPINISTSKHRSSKQIAKVKHKDQVKGMTTQLAIAPHIIYQLRCAKQERRSPIKTIHFTPDACTSDPVSMVTLSSDHSGHTENASVVSSYVGIANITTTSESSDLLFLKHFAAGVAYFEQSQFKKARKSFQTCTSLKGAHVPVHLMMSEYYLGEIELCLKTYPQALYYYQAATKTYRDNSKKCNKATTQCQCVPRLSAIFARCALCYEYIGKTNDAINHYKKALSYRNITKTDELTACIHLAYLYLLTEQNSIAFRTCHTALELAMKLGDPVSQSIAHGNLGNICLKRQDIDQALYHYEKSLALVQNSMFTIGRAYNKLGVSYLFRHNLDKAKECFGLALSHAICSIDVAGQARAYGNIGSVHFLRGNYQQSISLYNQAQQSLPNHLIIVHTAIQHNLSCGYHQQQTDFPLPSLNMNLSLLDIVDRCLSLTVVKDSADAGAVLGALGYYQSELYCEVRQLSSSEENFKFNDRNQQLQSNASDHEARQCLSICAESTKLTEDSVDHPTALKISHCRKTIHDTGPFSGITMNAPEYLSELSKQNKCPIVYLSCTHTKLTVWLFISNDSHDVKIEVFEVPLDDQNKHLLYTCEQASTSQSSENYFYDHENHVCSIQAKFNLIATCLKSSLSKHQFNSTVIIGIALFDSAHMPVTFYMDLTSKECTCIKGSSRGLQIAPENVCVPIELPVPICTIGAPIIPPFITIDGQVKILGQLPCAKEELEVIADVLDGTPLLGQQATLQVFLRYIQTTQVIHIATHGDSDGSSLAFTPTGVTCIDGSMQNVSSKSVLCYPEQVKNLNISAALVVLSSCDSGREAGVTDGIQGMARAFIQAGAQSVLTTLWKVPDKSATVFMQFFYQYLLDGFPSPIACDKAILSMRCMTSYKMPLHWNGYELYGKEVKIIRNHPLAIRKSLPPPTAFRSPKCIKKLEKELMESSLRPTNVQVFLGTPEAGSLEIVINFIHKHFRSFSKIFWVNCATKEMVNAFAAIINKDLHCHRNNRTTSHPLFVLVVQDIEKFKQTLSLHCPTVLAWLRDETNHVIVVFTSSLMDPDKVIDVCNNRLDRCCSFHEILPLSCTESMQRIIHAIMCALQFIPTDEVLHDLENIAGSAKGSSQVIDIVSSILINILKTNNQQEFMSALQSYGCNSDTLLAACNLSLPERNLLEYLSLVGANPIPLSFITELSLFVQINPSDIHTTIQKLLQFHLLRIHPSPVVHSPVLDAMTSSVIPVCVFVPDHISTSLVDPNTKNIDKEILKELLKKTYQTTRDPQIHALISLLEDTD